MSSNVGKNYKGLYLENLSQVISEKNIKPSEVRIIRHKNEIFGDLTDTPFNLWKKNPKDFKKLDAIQRQGAFGNQKYLLSFVATPYGETVLAKSYKILGQSTKPYSSQNLGYEYLLEEINTFSFLEGRLRIDWKKSVRVWNQIAGNSEKKVEFEEINSIDDLVIGKEYLRQDLHRAFGGNQQAGIVSLPDLDSVFLINSFSGEKYGYEDGWSGGVYKVSGEGHKGNQEIKRGNKALFEAIDSNKRIFLFEPVIDRDPYSHIFEGELRCIGFEDVVGLDVEGNTRKMFKFHFKSLNHPDLKNIFAEQFYKEIEEEIEYSFDDKEANSRVSLTPKVESDNDILVRAKGATVKKRREQKIQNEYIEYLRSLGYKADKSDVDIIAKKNNKTIFVEAKILTTQTRAAHGIGQLFYYEFMVPKEEKPNELRLLFDKKPNKKTIEFIKKFDISIVYKDKSSFIDI